MSAPIRLVATDLDGTVVAPDGSVSARTVAALRAVEEAGAHLVLVTGRPARWMAEVVAQVGHAGTAVCANGAVVYDLRTERFVATRPLDESTVHEVVAQVRDVLGAATFAAETVHGFVRDPAYVPRWDGADGDVRSIEEVARSETVLKLLVRDETSDGDSMLAAVGPALLGLAVPTHSNVRDCLLEISAIGVDKGSTLATLAAGLGVAAHETVAFGDMPNDVPMLRWAGVGYAVEGGHPAALASTLHRAGSVGTDGVARVLEHLLASGRIGAGILGR
ncbi:MAG TPA: HAD family hydrolase [Candidatus Limnocylindria bacterium]|nr:HAD family hydrolase [Candidatus Limnocylindria bacterium]